MPELRYKSAGHLAADLQAVADDQPLRYAREPIVSRAVGSLRRNRRRISFTAGMLVALGAVSAAALGLKLEQIRNVRLVRDEYNRGVESERIQDYAAAKVHFDNAVDLAGRFELGLPEYIAKLKDFGGLHKLLAAKFRDFRADSDLEGVKFDATVKGQIAERHERIQNDAEALFAAAGYLRFRLLWSEGGELPETSEELQGVLEPFYVLNEKNEDWTKNDIRAALLDTGTLARLVNDVNELLFLWITAIDESLASGRPASDVSSPGDDAQQVRERAVKICERVLVWVKPNGPWLALLDRLRQSDPTKLSKPPLARLAHEPSRTELEPSALAAFQWGMLNLRDGRLPRALEWLRRAVRLEDNNYWYHYLLAYLEDLAGDVDHALSNYSVAVALEPESPWVRFSRARLYRSKGDFDYALEDISSALRSLKSKGRPEACKVSLELGYLYQEMGDFKNARLAYEEVIRDDKTGAYAAAARLNRANIDAEQGAFDRARAEYDALLLRDWGDSTARFSRALLELRLGQPELAFQDATALLLQKPAVKNRDEVLAARALALLLLGRAAEACDDAAQAQRLRPSPAHERLRQRALLAAGRAQSLELDMPEDIALLPIAGRRLERDLRAMLEKLAETARAHPATKFRSQLNQAVIHAALGEPKAALDAATSALALSPYSARCFLVRARVRAYARDMKGAHEDVEHGLAIHASSAGLLELKGALLAAGGEPAKALEDLDQAIHWGAQEKANLHKAAALTALGRIDAAVDQWSRALRRDPELPGAYLGRAAPDDAQPLGPGAGRP